MKGVMHFGKGKLSPQYIVPCHILSRIRKVTYDLELPIELEAVHPVFHISILKKRIRNLTLIVPLVTIGVNDSLSFEEVPV